MSILVWLDDAPCVCGHSKDQHSGEGRCNGEPIFQTPGIRVNWSCPCDMYWETTPREVVIGSMWFNQEEDKPMKEYVWTVTHHVIHEESNIYGVFASRELADAKADELQKGCDPANDIFTVCRWKVQS